MNGRCSYPGMGFHPARGTLPLRTPGWGFHTEQGSINPENYRFHPQFVGVVDAWKDF